MSKRVINGQGIHGADPPLAGQVEKDVADVSVGEFRVAAVEMLQALYGSFHLYLATNGTASVQKSRLKSAEIEPFFEQIFISEELGCNKPETSFFERCFATIPDFKKEEAVMVGDSLTSDILGGIRAGIRTIWFNKDLKESSGEIRPDHTIKALSELPDLLRSM